MVIRAVAVTWKREDVGEEVMGRSGWAGRVQETTLLGTPSQRSKQRLKTGHRGNFEREARGLVPLVDKALSIWLTLLVFI